MLEAEEQAILESVERDEWKTVEPVEQEDQFYQRCAEAHMRAVEIVRTQLPSDFQVLMDPSMREDGCRLNY